MKVFWLKRAANELQAERAYIAKQNPTAAEQVADYLYNASLSLEALPYNAPESETKGIRDLIVTRYRYPYIIRYRVKPDRVEVIRMIHGRRNWRKRFQAPR